MSDKKHIDRLFQEKLKDFEAVPNDSVWESIEQKLHEKKRNRLIIPIWWQMAGVAAVLALLFTIGNSILKENFEKNISVKPIVNADTKDKASDSLKGSKTILYNGQNENLVVNEDDNEILGSDAKKINNVTQTQNKAITTIADAKNNSKNSKVYQKNADEINQALNNPKKETKIASNFKLDESTNYTTKNKSDQTKININQNKPKSDALIGHQQNDINTSEANDNSKSESLKLKDKNVNDTETIENAIAEVSDNDEKEESEKLSRWSISTNVAPVYFNTLGKGSSLDAQFVNNSKNGEINMSYGIMGSVAFNNKLKLRAGINKVDLGYSTNNIIVYKGTDIASISSTSRGKKNIKLNTNSESTTVFSAQNLIYSLVPNTIVVNINSSLKQELGFIEIPVELEYALLNKKIGVNVISGFSALFLDNNNIYSNLSGEKVLIGEAQNINRSSYSANFGLGLNYNVSEKIKLNLEPTFKYQINTFRDTSGNFQPYFIGIYTGLSYKF